MTGGIAAAEVSTLRATLRLECKFTTGTCVPLPLREVDSLRTSQPDSLGVVAALFWNGTRELHGGWLFVDAAESVRGRAAGTTNLSEKDIVRLDKTQPWLAGVRDEVHRRWIPFVSAFHALAMAGHERLIQELRQLHDSRQLEAQFANENRDILENDHRKLMKAIIDAHGPAGAGRIFQDLLAYTLGSAGYRTVRLNPVGVPDIEVTDLGQPAEECVNLTLTRTQLEALEQLASDAGKVTLVEALRRGFS
jgi:hypothetical protein